MELRANRFPEGKAAVAQALSLDGQQAQAAVVLGCQLAESNSEAGYQPIDAVADAALSRRAILPPLPLRSMNSPRACGRTWSR